MIKYTKKERMLTMFENTIAAISTSLQDGAISIIRLSGDKAIEITQKIFDRNIMNAKSHTIHYGFIIDTDCLLYTSPSPRDA